MESAQIVQGISQSVFGGQGNNALEAMPSDVQLDSFKQALESMSPSSIEGVPGDSVKISDPVVKATESTGGLTERFQSGIASIDSEFKGTMGRMESWPTFKNYLERFDTTLEKSISLDPDNNVRHVTNIDTSNDVLDVNGENVALSNEDGSGSPLVDKFEDMQEVSQNYYNAATQYNTESTMWYLKAEFWMTKVKVITSAMSQVSQGIKTLFRG